MKTIFLFLALLMAPLGAEAKKAPPAGPLVSQVSRFRFEVSRAASGSRPERSHGSAFYLRGHARFWNGIFLRPSREWI